jgi:multidrug efflux pump
VSPSRPFILRPVATSLLMAAILLAGFVAYLQLPVSALPEVDYPTIQVVTFYPGASPDVMASAVTAPLERQFGQVPGLNQMTSTSSDGSSIIVLQFSLELNIDVAEQEVQAAINAAQTYLPSDLPVPPIYSKTNPADTPILTLALSSKSIPLVAGRRSRRHPLRAKNLSTSRRGTGQHQRRPKAGRPGARESHGAFLLRHQPGGCAHGPAADQPRPGDRQLRRPATGLPDSIERPTAHASDFAQVIIAYHNGSPVKLSDVATVENDVENNRQAAWMNETPAVIVNIQRQPGANIIQVVDRIKKLLPLLKSNLPAAVQVDELTDRTTTIRASVKDVEFELMLTVALVVMVIFLFLRNLSAPPSSLALPFLSPSWARSA